MAETESQPTIEDSGHLGGGDFVTDGVHVSLTLTTEGLSWTNLINKNTEFLEWPDVIRCHKGKVSASKPLEVPGLPEREPSFTIHYIEKKPNRVWKHRYKIFHSSELNFDDILTTIYEQTTKDRPKRVLVLINPEGGTGKGKGQYNDVVAPLFKLAQIDTDVIVSEHPNHPEEIGEAYDFSTVDSVVVVGGDGTLHKLMRTWVSRIQREKGVDMNDPVAMIHPLTCKIGMIPTGTGNGLARGNYDTSDIATSALHIISGRTLKRTLVRLCQGGRHVGIATIVTCSGTFADVLQTNLENRRLGWFRYPVGLAAALFKRRREFDVQLEYLPLETTGNSEEKPEDEDTSGTEWKSLEGRFTGVFAMPGLFKLIENKRRYAINNDADGISLVLERQCGNFKYLRWLFKITQFKHDMFDEAFVDYYPVKEYRYRIIQREGEEKTERQLSLEKTLNLDGELVRLDNTDSNIEIRSIPNVMEMYGTGVH